MSKFWESLTDAVFGQLKNPFSLAFIGSWAAWNWKPITIYFRADESAAKLVDDVLPAYFNWDYFLVYPLVSMTIIVFVFPWLSYVCHKILNYGVVALKREHERRTRIFMKEEQDTNKLRAELEELADREILQKRIIKLEQNRQRTDEERVTWETGVRGELLALVGAIEFSNTANRELWKLKADLVNNLLANTQTPETTLDKVKELDIEATKAQSEMEKSHAQAITDGEYLPKILSSPPSPVDALNG